MASLPLSEIFPFSRDFNMATDCRPLFRNLKTVLQNGYHTLFGGISTRLPFTFRESNMGTVSFFGISKWLSSPCSGLHCGCNWLSRDFHHGYHILFSGFKNNCHPSFRNSSMAAMSLFGIPIWLPSTILVFAHGYISFFLLPSPFSAFEGKEKREQDSYLGLR